MARALVRDAELVLLDEPLVNLDYKLREALREELPQALAGRRSVVVYATTDPWEALSFGGKTAVLEQGRLLQYDVAAKVYAAPATTHVARVFSDPPMNLIEGTLDAGTLRLGDGFAGDRPAALAGLNEGCYLFGLRPEHLALTAQENSAKQIGTTIEVTEISGSDTYIHFTVADRSWVAIENGVHDYELGKPVALSFDAERLFVFDTDGQLLFSPERDATRYDDKATVHGAH
jgi:glycerol transport system ATP-binding protein